MNGKTLDITKPIQIWDDTGRGPTIRVVEVQWSNGNVCVALVPVGNSLEYVMIDLRNNAVHGDEMFLFYYAENIDE